jgi:hypothetical protein
MCAYPIGWRSFWIEVRYPIGNSSPAYLEDWALSVMKTSGAMILIFFALVTADADRGATRYKS